MAEEEVDYYRMNNFLNSSRRSIFVLFAQHPKRPAGEGSGSEEIKAPPEQKAVPPEKEGESLRRRDALAKCKQAVAWAMRKTAVKFSNGVKLKQCIIYYLQLLSLPDQCVSPKKLVFLITKAIRLIGLALRFDHCNLALKSKPFFDYMFIYKNLVGPDRLLYIYSNLDAEAFRKFICKLKRRLISVIYEAATFGFKLKFEDEELLQLWALHWVRMGILKEDKEVYELTRLRIVKDIDKYKSEPVITMKFFIKEQSQPAVKKGPIVAGAVQYTGEKSKVYETYMKRFAKKKTEKLGSYIEDFYELFLKLSSPKLRKDYFKEEKEYVGFLKSSCLSQTLYFVSEFASLQKYKHYIQLWDILRLVGPHLSPENRGYLSKRFEEILEKVDRLRYRYNVEQVEKCFHRALAGDAIVETGEPDGSRSVDLSGLKLRVGESQREPYTFDGYYKIMCSLMKQSNEETLDRFLDEDIMKDLDELIHSAKVEGLSQGEAIRSWFEAVLRKKKYSVDLWKKQRNMVYGIRDLKYIDAETAKKFDETLMARLGELERTGTQIMRITRVNLLANGMTEDKLTVTSSQKDIDEFIKENDETVKQSYGRIERMAREIYEQQRAPDDRYPVLEKVLARSLLIA